MTRGLIDDEELLLIRALQKNSIGARAHEQLVPEARRELVAARLGERQDRELGRLDVLVQKLAVKAPDRGNEEKDFRQKDVDERQQQQTSRQALGKQPGEFADRITP